MLCLCMLRDVVPCVLRGCVSIKGVVMGAVCVDSKVLCLWTVKGVVCVDNKGWTVRGGVSVGVKE